MDTSDFYPIAEQALEALESATPPLNKLGNHLAAMNSLRSFLACADDERFRNNSRAFYKCHVREGEKP